MSVLQLSPNALLPHQRVGKTPPFFTFLPQRGDDTLQEGHPLSLWRVKAICHLSTSTKHILLLFMTFESLHPQVIDIRDSGFNYSTSVANHNLFSCKEVLIIIIFFFHFFYLAQF